MSEVKSVLFDMDGVIVDSMRNHADSWLAVLREGGLELTEIDIFKREGMSGESSVRDIFHERGKPAPDRQSFHRMLQKKHDLFESNPVSVFPCVSEILDLLKRQSVTLALVTGSLRRTIDHLVPADLLRLFDVIISADDLTRGKPDPAPYLAALDRLKCAPGDALAVENAPMGILSAKNAGLFCIAVETTLPAEHLGLADAVISDHRELYFYLKERILKDSGGKRL